MIDGGDSEECPNKNMITEAVQRTREQNSKHRHGSSNEKLLALTKSNRSIKDSSMKASVAMSCKSRVQPSTGASFLNMGTRQRGRSIDEDFRDKDLRVMLEEYFEKERNSFTYRASQWQHRRRASTGQISQSTDHKNFNVGDSTSMRQQRRKESPSMRTTQGRTNDCSSIAVPASDSDLVQEQGRKDYFTPLFVLLDEQLDMKNANPDRSTSIRGRTLNRRASTSSCSSAVTASHNSTIDEELPPDDDSASSVDTNKDGRCHSALERSSASDDDSDSLDVRTLSLCEFFKGQQLHDHTYTATRRVSSVCSDIQSECDEYEHGSCSSGLFRPYVAGSGSRFMNMSGICLDHRECEQRDAVSDDGIPKKTPHRPMRRAGGSVE